MPLMATPNLEGPREDRIYELRSYISATENLYWNKVDMFNAGGEIKLFDDLTFNAVFYAEVLSGPSMPNLMYMTSFANMESREKHWGTFGKHPDWDKLKSMEEYQNNVSGINIMLLHHTAYSDF